MQLDLKNNRPESLNEKLNLIIDNIPQEKLQEFLNICGSIIGLFACNTSKKMDIRMMEPEMSSLKKIISIDEVIIILAHFGLVINQYSVEQVIPNNLMMVRMQELVESLLVKLHSSNVVADNLRNTVKNAIENISPNDAVPPKVIIEGTVKFKHGGLCVEDEKGKIWAGEKADEKLTNIPLGAWVTVYKGPKDFFVHQKVS